MTSERRIAILSDIHGNRPAFEEVVKDIGQQGVDAVIVAGDLVGRGPEGTRIVERVAALQWPSIRGNHEDYLLGFVRRQVPDAWWNLDEWSASRWMAAELSSDAVRFIEQLPDTMTPDFAPGMCVVHGSTRSNTEGLGPWTDEDYLVEELERGGHPLLVCGHTHRAMVKQLPQGTVANIGSVGLPFNKDQRAQYAIFTLHEGRWEAELRQVTYDLDDAFRAYQQTGFWRAGGVTAQLLALELHYATPFLVPFLRWAHDRKQRPEPEHIDLFLQDFYPHERMARFNGIRGFLR